MTKYKSKKEVKMAKRQLNEKEKQICEASMERLVKEKSYLKNAELKRLALNIELAPIEYEKQLSDMKIKRDALVAQVNEMEKSIEILKQQIKEGVEVKKTNDKETK